MKKQIFFILFLFFAGILIFSCSKEENRTETNTKTESIEARNGKQGYIEHSPEEIAYIHSIKTIIDYHNHFDFGSDFENIKGLPDWDLAVIPLKNGGDYNSVIVPIIKANEINAFFHVFEGEELTYFYVDKILIRPPYFVYGGPVNHLFEQFFHFYEHVLTSTPFEEGTGYEDTFDNNPEFGGCYITLTTEVNCSCANHTWGETCYCQSQGGTGPSINYTTTSVPCEDENGGGAGPGTSTGSGNGNGSYGSNNNNNNNNTDPKIHAAFKAAWSVCPFIPQEVCKKLMYIIDNAENSPYCLNIPTQVADLLQNPTSSNIAAATCYVMNTSIQEYPSASNTCSNPFSMTPLADFAEMYNEMSSSLINWAVTYPGLDNIPCELTLAGYTSEEKNQILQTFKDYLGNPPAIGVNDNSPASNPEMDKVNALNAVISNDYFPELIDLIPLMLGWDNFDNVPDIANFLKSYSKPITQDVKNMLGLASNVSDKIVLNRILTLVQDDEDIEAIQAASMTFVSYNTSSLYGPYDLAYHTKINPYTEADITDPTLLAIWAKYFSAHCSTLKKEHQTGSSYDWTDDEVYFHASLDMIHLSFDLAGLIPVFGEVFDITNGIIYTIEGDGLNAALSYSAAIPVVGWVAAGGKLALKGKWALLINSNGVVDFGRKLSSKFRIQLGLVKGDGKHAHHIIPWLHKELDLVQRAAKSENAFHMNEVLNGIPLPSGNHLTGHGAYNLKLGEKLEQLTLEATSDNEAYNLLTGLIGQINNFIKNNPNMNLGQIAELID